MPCLNSSGKVASESSSTPSARSPFQVKASVTHRLLEATVVSTSAADCTLSRSAATQARPAAASRNETNSYCPVSAGVRVSRMCWMSFSSSMALVPRDHCIWSSISENAAFSFRAFLISSALT